MIKKINLIIGIGILVLVLNLSLLSAAANFAVTSFSCSPSEVVVNNVFSCTAQIQNTGDIAGTVNIATLYSDENNWLENSNYPQSSGNSLSPGQSTEVIFSGLRATKSGDNGFSKIMLDSVTDRYVSDNGIKINVINVLITLEDLGSTTTAEVTAGGSIDVLLTFTGSGCSLGSQPSQKTISGMTDGSKQSRTWTITSGCAHKVSASATGIGGVATKTDYACVGNCPGLTSEGSNGNNNNNNNNNRGGGGGGSAGGGSSVWEIGELISAGESGGGEGSGGQPSVTKDLYLNGAVGFNISRVHHKLTLTNYSATSVVITIESEKQTFTLNIGDEVKVDLNLDGVNDISVRLDSVNMLTNSAKLTITNIVKSAVVSPINGAVVDNSVNPNASANTNKENILGGAENVLKQSNNNWILIILVIAVVIVLVIIGIVLLGRKKKNNLVSKRLQQ